MHASCLEAQRDELAVLASILGTDLIESDVGLRWRIAADMGSERSITLLPWNAELRLQFLPDIVACATLPSLYPEQQPPVFYFDCYWLPQAVLTQWAADATNLWTPGSVCIYDVCLMLQQASEQYLSQLHQLDFQSIFPSAPCAQVCDEKNVSGGAASIENSSDEVRRVLVTFDQRRGEEAFKNTHFSCPICLETKMGPSCYRFIICRHVSCRSCLSGYFESIITEGAASSVGCPVTSCRVPPLDVELKALVVPHVYERYERLTLERSLLCCGAVDCPLCKKPAWPEHPQPQVSAGAAALSDHETNAYRNLARCGYCGYSFCLLCRTPWHLGRRCFSNDLNKLLAKYRAAGDSERHVLESMFGGPGSVLASVATAAFFVHRSLFSRSYFLRLEEEQASMTWIHEMTKSCPRCSNPIEVRFCPLLHKFLVTRAHSSQKNGGCNHMKCERCSLHFCWLCMSSISGYEHFSGGCKLFTGGQNFDNDWF